MSENGDDVAIIWTGRINPSDRIDDSSSEPVLLGDSPAIGITGCYAPSPAPSTRTLLPRFAEARVDTPLVGKHVVVAVFDDYPVVEYKNSVSLFGC